MYLDALIQSYRDHLPRSRDPQGVRDEIENLQQHQRDLLEQQRRNASRRGGKK